MSPTPQRAHGHVWKSTHTRLLTRVLRPFWVLPLLISLAGFALGLVVPEIDDRFATDLPYVFQGGPDGARSLLGTVASAMVTVTGLVFSITMVVLQLASSQFTPRVLGRFLSSRIVQATLGVFTASFVYALTVLRLVRGDADSPFVPQIAVTIAFALVLASVAFFLAFIHHITSSIQVENVIRQVAATARRRVARDRESGSSDDHHSGESANGPADQAGASACVPLVVMSTRSGYVAEVNEHALACWAADRDALITVEAPLGGWVNHGRPLALIYTEVGADESEQDLVDMVRSEISLEAQRDAEQDTLAPVRQLVDIADRALSPGINDPTTASSVLDHPAGVLTEAGQRPDPAPAVAVDGVVRLVHHLPTFADLARLSVEEIAHYGADTVQIPRRLDRLLDELRMVCRPEHLPVIAGLRDEISRDR